MSENKNWVEGDIDFSTVRKGPPPPLDNGLYGFIVADATLSEKRATSGAPTIKLELQITNKRNEEKGSLKRKVFANITLNE